MKKDTHPSPKKKPRRVKLKNLDDIRRYLAKLLNDARPLEVTPVDAAKLAYIANILAGVIRDMNTAEIEERVRAELMERLQEMETKHATR